MASVNKVILIGNLGRDPEVRSFPNGGQIANVSIATTEAWKDKQTGERKEHTEWHNVVFANGLADIVAQYLKKGSSIYVEGRLRTRKWQDQNGNDRYSTEIRADGMQMLGGRDNGVQNSNQAPQGQQRSPQTPQQQAPQQYGGGGGFTDDDIPFNAHFARAAHLAVG